MRMIESILTRIGGRQEEIKRQRLDSFAEIVKAAADNVELDPDAVVQVLDASGKTVDDLMAAVEQINQRRRWREEVDRMPAARAEITELNARLKAEQEEFHAVAAKYAESRKAISRRLDELSNV